MYKAKDIQAHSGIDTRRIQYYVDLGLASFQDNPGRGPSGRTYSEDDVFQIYLADYLSRECFLELSQVKKIFYAIKEISKQKLAPNYLACATYDAEAAPGYFLQIFPGEKKIQIGERFLKKDGKRLDNVQVDLDNDIHVIVINLSKIREKIFF